jgi:hypothetical protein
MRSFAIKVVVNALAIWLATLVVTGVRVSGPDDSTSGTVLTFLVIGLIFGLVNAVVKPVVKVLTFPVFVRQPRSARRPARRQGLKRGRPAPILRVRRGGGS